MLLRKKMTAILQERLVISTKSINFWLKPPRRCNRLRFASTIVLRRKKVKDGLKIAFPQYLNAEEVGNYLPKNSRDTEMSLLLLCKYCKCSPCYIHSIYDLLTGRGEELEGQGCTNRSIMYALYRIASEEYHGRLGHGNRKKLPTCIIDDFRDLFPEPGKNYIGFCLSPETK